MKIEHLFAVRPLLDDARDADGTPLLAHWLTSDPGLAQAIDARRMAVHTCVFGCGQQAKTAVYWPPSDIFGLPKWIDACWPHWHELRDMLEAESWDHGKVAGRWAAWQEAGLG